MNSFFPRAIRLWKGLLTEVKDAPTVTAFTCGLNKFPFHQINITYYSCCLVPVWRL